MKKIIVPVLLSMILAACGSSRTNEQSAQNASDTNAGSSVSSSILDQVRDPNSILSHRSVYFSFDSYAVPSSDADLVEAHANFLSKNSTVRMLIQGNADERGSSEYNLALGQKRAEAVKRALTLRGVNENQVEAVSLGKEKPRCTESNETCYAENRRADMLYSGEF